MLYNKDQTKAQHVESPDPTIQAICMTSAVNHTYITHSTLPTNIKYTIVEYVRETPRAPQELNHTNVLGCF